MMLERVTGHEPYLRIERRRSAWLRLKCAICHLLGISLQLGVVSVPLVVAAVVEVR